MKPLHLLSALLLSLGLLAPPAAGAISNRKLTKLFLAADLDRDSRLTHQEFIGVQNRKLSWVATLFLFNVADANGDGYLSELEYFATNGGATRRKMTKSEIYYLADRDDDGQLDPEEYSLVVKKSTPWFRIMKAFSKADKNNDALLSPREFGLR